MITMFFGSPGSGKTTLGARMVYLNNRKKRYSKIYTNFECVGAYRFDCSDFSLFAPEPDSLVIIDEAGIDFNNRKYKELSQSMITFFKLHRHYSVDIIFLSQSWEDVDITIRRLCDKLIYIKKLGPFTMTRDIRKFVLIDKDTKQIIDGYSFNGFFDLIFSHKLPFKLFYRRPYYFMFDSYSRMYRPSVQKGMYSDIVLPKHIYVYSSLAAVVRLKDNSVRLFNFIKSKFFKQGDNCDIQR